MPGEGIVLHGVKFERPQVLLFRGTKWVWSWWVPWVWPFEDGPVFSRLSWSKLMRTLGWSTQAISMKRKARATLPLFALTKRTKKNIRLISSLLSTSNHFSFYIMQCSFTSQKWSLWKLTCMWTLWWMILHNLDILLMDPSFSNSPSSFLWVCFGFISKWLVWSHLRKRNETKEWRKLTDELLELSSDSSSSRDAESLV